MKFFVAIFIISFTVFPVSRYEEIDFLNTKAYFPKSNNAYLNELLNEESEEAFLSLALFYLEFGEKDLALRYLEEYSGTKYLKKSKIYKLLEMQEKEFEILKDEGFAFLSRENYNYFLNLSEKLSVDLPYKYSSYELLSLINTIDKHIKFYEKYHSKNWSLEEKKYIYQMLKQSNLTSSSLVNILYEFLPPEEKLLELYKRIDSLEDKEAYYEYFSFQEKLNIYIGEQNDFERLHRYKYNHQVDKFEKLYKKMLNQFLEESNFNKLMSLYLINFNYRLAYNLAMVDEGLHFKFLSYIMENEKKELGKRSLIDFYNKYPKTKFQKEVKEFFIYLEEDKELKIELMETYFLKYFNEEILDIYLSLIKNQVEEKDYIKRIENMLFVKGIENKKLIDLYLEFILSDKINGDKLILLSNKDYYFDYISKNSIRVIEYLEDAYISFLVSNSKFNILKDYRDKIDLDTYKTLIQNGQKEFLELARKKYPFKKEFLDENNIKNFYFIDDFYYKKNIAKQIKEKERKSPVEEYYLMNYFYQENINLEEADLIYERLSRRYLLLR